MTRLMMWQTCGLIDFSQRHSTIIIYIRQRLKVNSGSVDPSKRRDYLYSRKMPSKTLDLMESLEF